MTDPTPLPFNPATGACKLGAGPACCSYLVFGPSWACAKGSGLEPLLRARRAAGGMTATGDNCTGPPDFAERGLELVAEVDS